MDICILNYIKPNNQDLYNKIIEIVKTIENFAQCEIYIYGGFIRNIIDNYYSNNNLTPTDIDLWFNFGENINISYNYWKEKIEILLIQLRRVYQVENNYIFFDMRDTRDKYGLCKIKINGIIFDFCTKINNENRFDILCDYTVNNLYIKTNGELYTRINTLFTLNEIINHIESKKLISIINQYLINSYIELDKHNNNYYHDYYHDLFEKRKNKMIEFRYN